MQEAPDVPMWETAPAISVDGYRAGVVLPGAPPGGTTPYVFLGSERVKGMSAAFDVRVLEPASGATSKNPIVVAGRAYADVRVTHREGRTIYHQTITSATVAPALPPLVPPSRGSPCKLAFADGRVEDDRPCLATDGNLTVPVWEPRHPTGDAAATTTIPGVASVTAELITAVDVESVFVRVCHRDCLVEVSADGSRWAQPRAGAVVLAVSRARRRAPVT